VKGRGSSWKECVGLRLCDVVGPVELGGSRVKTAHSTATIMAEYYIWEDVVKSGGDGGARRQK